MLTGLRVLLLFGLVWFTVAAAHRARRAGAVPCWTLLGRVGVWSIVTVIGLAIAEPCLRHLGLPDACVVPVALIAMLGVVYVGGRLGDAVPGAPLLRRGAQVLDSTVQPPVHPLTWIAAQARRLAAPPSTVGQPMGLQIGGRSIPEADEPKHFKFIGTTGTGKSTAIHALLRAALARGDRAVIADPDGGYLARTYDVRRGDLILNPFDERSAVWQPFDEIDAPEDARELARALIGSASGEAAAWHGYAETFLASVLERLKCLPESPSAELYRVLSSAPLTELRAILAGTAAAPLVESGNERMFGSVRAIAMSRLAALPVILRQSGVHAGVRRWIREGSGVLYLPYRANQIATLRHLVSAWVRLAIFETMALGESDRRLWFVVDELDALGAIDGLKDALARLRKFGGRCVLGFQSIAQVSGTYGESEARTIVENCATTLILRCSASEGGGTARFASQLIGQREIERIQESRSRGERDGRVRVSHTRQVAVEQAVLPAEIEALADLEGYLKQASDPGWRKVVLPRGF
jgi:type IV secretory pathway TraG/TraD family ATPase VirD4